MSAAALSETRPAADGPPPLTSRSDLLLHEEIAHVHAELATLTPSAKQSLQRVLDSILGDRDLAPTTTAAARQLLYEIATRHSGQGGTESA